MPDDYEKLLKLLKVLADHGMEFEVKNGDTIYLIGLDPKMKAIIPAILEAAPDEVGWEEGKFRLWWD